MSAVAWVTQHFLAGNRYLALAGTLVVAVVVFGAACQVLRIQEFGELLGVLKFGAKPKANH
jgi:hypothetical protein